MGLMNSGQLPDKESWETNDSEFFSIVGHRSESDFPVAYDWDELLRSNENYQLVETSYNPKSKSVEFGEKRLTLASSKKSSGLE